MYNSDGTLCYKQKRDGDMESYSYDALGRCVAIGATDANFETTGSKIFTYDKNGNLLFDGVVTRTYDAFGRVLTQSQAGFDTVTYTYDTPFELFIIGLENGYEETISSPELGTIGKDYDSSGNLYATQSNADMVLYSYNAAGLCTTKHFTQARHYTYYTYNTEGQITEITDGTVVFDYTYDNNANMTSETRKENGVVKCVKNYTYDKANRLVSETNSEQNFRINYTYDNANNITAKTKCNLETGEVIESKAYTYNANNQIAENSLYYDNGGIFHDSYYWYSYDGFDRLKMVYFSLNDGRDSYSYEYASDNLRTSTTQLAFMTDEVVAVTRYLYDKDGNILAEKKNNVLGNVYIYGNSLENLLIGYNVYRYTTNAHGDVVKVYSGSTVVAEYDYEAYGENIKCTENGISNPIRYAGYYYDADTEKYYLKNRYYDGTRGRFLTEDPYWNVSNMLYGNVTDDVVRNVYYPAVVQSGNRFAYCMGNPVNWSDPTGCITEEEIELYKNGQLSKDVYDILVDLGERWENASTQAARDEIHSLAEQFRNNDYKYEDLTFNAVLQLYVNGKFIEKIVDPPTLALNESVLSLATAGIEWYLLVDNYGLWDYKRNPAFWMPSDSKYFAINGKLISFADYGNINYGYTGTVLGLSEKTLYKGAGYVQTGQINDDPSQYYGDSEVDYNNVRKGISLANGLGYTGYITLPLEWIFDLRERFN